MQACGGYDGEGGVHWFGCGGGSLGQIKGLVPWTASEGATFGDLTDAEGIIS